MYHEFLEHYITYLCLNLILLQLLLVMMHFLNLICLLLLVASFRPSIMYDFIFFTLSTILYVIYYVYCRILWKSEFLIILFVGLFNKKSQTIHTTDKINWYILNKLITLTPVINLFKIKHPLLFSVKKDTFLGVFLVL